MKIEENNMKVIKTKDGYETYEVEKDGKSIVIGSKYNYQRIIDSLLEKLQAIDENTVIVIFGLDQGAYLSKLKEKIHYRNKVIIVEPIEEVAIKFKKDDEDNVKVISMEEMPEHINRTLIDINNVNNVIVHTFGNYSRAFSEEYKSFVKRINNIAVSLTLNINTIKKFKDESTQNLLNNLYEINGAYSSESLLGRLEGATGIVVSAGPSLDKNLEVLCSYKDKIKDYVIIAGNRTVKPLVENGIIPDYVCAIDPQEVVYDMLKDYEEYKIPLIFNENTNCKLVSETKGIKIFGSKGLVINLQNHIKEIIGYYFSGGSVAHMQVDVAVKLGCKNVILLGQDLAYTFKKHHSEVTKNKIDANESKKTLLTTKDVFGDEIITDYSLNTFRINLENYINLVKQIKDINLINCSYGAAIEGTTFMELEEVLQNDNFDIVDKKIEFNKINKISFDFDKLILDMSLNIKNLVSQMDICIKKCENNQRISSEKKIKENLIFIKKTNDKINEYKELQIFEYYIGDFLLNSDSYFKFSVQDSKDPMVYAQKLSKGYEGFFKDLKNKFEKILEVLNNYKK